MNVSIEIPKVTDFKRVNEWSLKQFWKNESKNMELSTIFE